MPSPPNIFKKFENEINSLEQHIKHSRLFESNMNNFFNQIKNLTVSIKTLNFIELKEKIFRKHSMGM